MSQRNSNYARQPNDLYETPPWATRALVPHIPSRVKSIWEPACGTGQMSTVLINAGYTVTSTDLATGTDFIINDMPVGLMVDAIITNPPFKRGMPEKFIQRALEYTSYTRGFVAMLLRVDFDSGKTRKDLFKYPFSTKLTLTERLVLFKRNDGIREAPSENHAWFLWNWEHQGAPVIAYGP